MLATLVVSMAMLVEELLTPSIDQKVNHVIAILTQVWNRFQWQYCQFP